MNIPSRITDVGNHGSLEDKIGEFLYLFTKYFVVEDLLLLYGRPFLSTKALGRLEAEANKSVCGVHLF